MNVEQKDGDNLATKYVRNLEIHIDQQVTDNITWTKHYKKLDTIIIIKRIRMQWKNIHHLKVKDTE